MIDKNYDDPIVREVRDTRAALWEESGHSFDKLLAEAKAFARSLGVVEYYAGAAVATA